MVLGETLKLGYLECAVGGDHCAVLRNSSSSPVLERANALGGTLKLSGNNKIESASCKGYVQDEPPICPLDWTHAPAREVQKQGNMRYQVSKPAVPSRRNMADGKMHLVRTTRIDPQPVSRSSSRPSSGRLQSAEKLVVTEADFRRCGKRLTLLRQCQLEQVAPKPRVVEEVKNELELSFKSAFRNRCHADHYIADPWAGYGNPEEYRAANEGDLVLNQVWVDKPSHQKCESGSDEDPDCTLLPSARSIASTNASSRDGISSWPLGPSSTELKKQETDYARSRRSSRRPPSHRRAQSLSAISANPPTCSRTHLPSSVTTPAREVSSRDSLRESRRESRSRQAGHASGIPKPASASGRGRESSVKRGDSTEKPKEKPKEYENRIQLIVDDSLEDDGNQDVGSHAVRQALRAQRRFEKEMDVDNEFNAKPLALWVSLDPLTGQVDLFSRAAATRLEGAHVNHRMSVPLAGLGDGLDDSIVCLGKKGSDERPVLKSFTGGQLDVRRLQVRAGAREACVDVVCSDNMWNIADVPVPGAAAEQRRIVLNGTEMVRPPTPPLPPLDPDRRLCFSNIGADPEHQY